MIVSLYQLTLMIETLHRVDQTEIPARLYSISVACSDNFPLALHAHREAGNVDRASNAVRLYHIQLLWLHQKLTAFCTEKDIEDRSALTALEQLLERIEFLFKNDIDPTTNLPCHYRDKISTYVYNRIPAIFDRLAKKNIPLVYLHEIHSAIDSLFEEGKIPYIQYRHQEYLIQLLDALAQLAEDNRQRKNWHCRFLILMINFNFNHMGFFNRWKEFYQTDPIFMENLLRFPKHFSCIRDFAYDSNRSSLLKLMCEYVQTELSQSQQTSSEKDDEQFIHSNFNGKELKLWLHLCVKANITRSSEKKEVAAEFSKLIKTKEGILLTPHTLTKMDKSVEYAAAVRILRTLNNMQAELRELFPDLKS